MAKLDQLVNPSRIIDDRLEGEKGRAADAGGEGAAAPGFPFIECPVQDTRLAKSLGGGNTLGSFVYERDKSMVLTIRSAGR